MTGSESLPGGSPPRARSAASAASIVGAGQPGGEHPLADLPFLELVQLDRQGVVDLVRVGADAEPEPLTQESAHRVPDESDQVLELDHAAGDARQRPRQERAWARCAPR